jgi:hypothetical protein
MSVAIFFSDPLSDAGKNSRKLTCYTVNGVLKILDVIGVALYEYVTFRVSEEG